MKGDQSFANWLENWNLACAAPNRCPASRRELNHCLWPMKSILLLQGGDPWHSPKRCFQPFGKKIAGFLYEFEIEMGGSEASSMKSLLLEQGMSSMTGKKELVKQK